MSLKLVVVCMLVISLRETHTDGASAVGRVPPRASVAAVDVLNTWQDGGVRLAKVSDWM